MLLLSCEFSKHLDHSTDRASTVHTACALILCNETKSDAKSAGYKIIDLDAKTPRYKKMEINVNQK